MGTLAYYTIMFLMSLIGLFAISVVVYMEVNDRKTERENQLRKI